MWKTMWKTLIFLRINLFFRIIAELHFTFRGSL